MFVFAGYDEYLDTFRKIQAEQRTFLQCFVLKVFFFFHFKLTFEISIDLSSTKLYLYEALD